MWRKGFSAQVSTKDSAVLNWTELIRTVDSLAVSSWCLDDMAMYPESPEHLSACALICDLSAGSTRQPLTAGSWPHVPYRRADQAACATCASNGMQSGALGHMCQCVC